MYRGPQWYRLTAVLNRITFHDYATSGTEGVAVALWALVTSWERPEQAIIVAASFAGSAPVTSQLAGGVTMAIRREEAGGSGEKGVEEEEVGRKGHPSTT